MHSHSLVLAAILIGFGTAAASAQTTTLSKDDESFLKDAYQGGLYEIQTGQYAAANGKAEAVKQFGQQMANEHGELNLKVAELAKKHNVTLEMEPSAVTAAKIKAETVLTGAPFDKTYLPLMIHAHEGDIKDFEAELASTKNPDLTAAVKDALPTLRHHLKMAKQAKLAAATP